MVCCDVDRVAHSRFRLSNILHRRACHRGKYLALPGRLYNIARRSSARAHAGWICRCISGVVLVCSLCGTSSMTGGSYSCTLAYLGKTCLVCPTAKSIVPPLSSVYTPFVAAKANLQRHTESLRGKASSSPLIMQNLRFEKNNPSSGPLTASRNRNPHMSGKLWLPSVVRRDIAWMKIL